MKTTNVESVREKILGEFYPHWDALDPKADPALIDRFVEFVLWIANATSAELETLAAKRNAFGELAIRFGIVEHERKAARVPTPGPQPKAPKGPRRAKTMFEKVRS